MKQQKQNREIKGMSDLGHGKGRITDEDENPENFDDGDTQVAPKGEFKSGDNPQAKIEDKAELEVRKRVKADIKNELDPLYSISIGSWYDYREMLQDVTDLMIAENSLGITEGKKLIANEEIRFLFDLGFDVDKSTKEKIQKRINQLKETN